MITEKTVFILGAGASCPYGFPSGAQLREDIRFKFQDVYSRYAYRIWKREIEDVERPIVKFIDKFYNSTTKSIDLFMAGNPTLVETGKYIIAFEMLGAEQKSCFREESQIRAQDWYSYLFNRMRDTIKNKTEITKFTENNVSFITFNYDRSLEYFFYESLRNSFTEVPEQEIITILKQLKIIHVYGAIAPLDWQDGENGVKYRTQITESVLQKTSRNLRTIYEETQNPELLRACKLIEEATRIFFLGFGYAEENINILSLPRMIPLHSKVYGTGFGLEQGEIKKIYNGIWNGLKEHPETRGKRDYYEVVIENKHCLELLRNYLQ